MFVCVRSDHLDYANHKKQKVQNEIGNEECA